MPGFGDDPFGISLFGLADWSRRVLYEDTPEPDRAQDPERLFERYAESTQEPFESLIQNVARFPELRDPDRVRSRYSERVAVTLLTAHAGADSVEVEVDPVDPDDPFAALGWVSAGWTLVDSAGTEFTVTRVHKTYSSGGPRLVVGGGVGPRTEAHGPGLGSAYVRPASMIELLGADYGVEVDRHEPDAFQRSSVRNAHQWLSIKGVERAYDVLGKIAGYEVDVLGLWRVDPVPSAIPADRLYESPIGSGRYYTDLAPLRPVFDEVAADTVPLDIFCWETPDWVGPPPLTPPIPSPPAGFTLREAIGWTTTDLPLSVVTGLGAGRWRVAMAGDLRKVAWIGHWYLEHKGQPGVKLWLETLPEETAPGIWEFEVLAGEAPGFLPEGSVGYECRPAMGCGYCRASLIRVELEPDAVLTDPEAVLENALPRITRKVRNIVPVHVRTTEIVHIVRIAAVHDMDADIRVNAVNVMVASVGYYFDIVPADALPLDPEHMVATIVSTIL